jgi:hypothetical protein
MSGDGNQSYFKARLDDGVNTNDFMQPMYGPAVGLDGNLWYHAGFYTSPNIDLLGQITPDGTVSNFVLEGRDVVGDPNQLDGEFSGGMTVAPDGTLWLGVSGSRILRIDLDGHLMGVIHTTIRLGEMTTGPAGVLGLWF